MLLTNVCNQVAVCLLIIDNGDHTRITLKIIFLDLVYDSGNAGQWKADFKAKVRGLCICFPLVSITLLFTPIARIRLTQSYKKGDIHRYLKLTPFYCDKFHLGVAMVILVA